MNATIEIEILVNRQGVWRDIVRVVPEASALDECKRALARKGVLRIKCGGWTYDRRP